MIEPNKLIATALLCLHTMLTHAAIDPALLAPLAGDDPDARIEAVGKIAALANDDAYKVLSALKRASSTLSTPAGSGGVISRTSCRRPPSRKTRKILAGTPRWDISMLLPPGSNFKSRSFSARVTGNALGSPPPTG